MTPKATAFISTNLAALREKLPATMTLVAVSKHQPVELILAAHAAGITDFGENRVEELAAKHDVLPTTIRHQITWHMIGTVQTNKAAAVATTCDWVHSVDRLKLVPALSKAAQSLHKTLHILLQVNLSGELTKHGFAMSQWETDPQQLPQFCAAIEHIINLPNLQLHGLMTIAPDTMDQQIIRSVFKRTRDLQTVLRQRFPHQEWSELSMGMSNDFQIAVEEGATMIRLGRAVFERPKPEVYSSNEKK